MTTLKTRCPNCGVLHTIEESQPNIFQSTQKFPTVATYTPAPAKENGHPSVGSHVLVPFLQSIVPGFFLSPLGAMLGMAGVYFYEGLNHQEMTTGGILLMIVGGVFSTICVYGFYQWTYKRLPVFDSTLYTVEEYTQTDINQDGIIGKPTTIRVELTENGITRHLEDFDISPDKLAELARLVLILKSGFSETTARRAGISRDEFIELRNKMIERGWATWNHPQEPRQGVSLRREGEKMLRGLLDSSPLPER